MTDFAAFRERLPRFISSYTDFCGAIGEGGGPSRAPASTSWGTANRAIYIPFTLPVPYPVKRVFWGNGSVAGNMDFGIYSAAGKRIYSTGSTAQTPTSGIQYVTITNRLWLPPGRYYMGIVNNGTTNRGWANSHTLGYQQINGVLQQASALPLPDPAVFAALTGGTVSFIPLCGITRTAS